MGCDIVSSEIYFFFFCVLRPFRVYFNLQLCVDKDINTGWSHIRNVQNFEYILSVQPILSFYSTEIISQSILSVWTLFFGTFSIFARNVQIIRK